MTSQNKEAARKTAPIRARAQARYDRMVAVAGKLGQEREVDPVELMRGRSDALAQRAANLKKLADAWAPLRSSRVYFLGRRSSAHITVACWRLNSSLTSPWYIGPTTQKAALVACSYDPAGSWTRLNNAKCLSEFAIAACGDSVGCRDGCGTRPCYLIPAPSRLVKRWGFSPRSSNFGSASLRCVRTAERLGSGYFCI